jgi:Protein of unknown function (DUF3892)
LLGNGQLGEVGTSNLECGMIFSHDGAAWPRFEIACVDKPDRESLVEHITHVGGYDAGQWKLPVEEVIRRIEGCIEGFFIRVGANELNVFVASPKGAKKHIRTNPDLTQLDNLLNLPRCK